MNLKTLTLENLQGGGLGELFQRELDRVLRNIDDPNTPAEKIRRITIDLLIKPTEDRESAAIATAVRSTVPGVTTKASMIFLAKESGHPIAYLRDPRQSELFGEDQEHEDHDNNVTPLKKAKEGRTT